MHLYAYSVPIVCLCLENVKIPQNLGLFGSGKEETKVLGSAGCLVVIPED